MGEHKQQQLQSVKPTTIVSLTDTYNIQICLLQVKHRICNKNGWCACIIMLVGHGHLENAFQCFNKLSTIFVLNFDLWQRILIKIINTKRGCYLSLLHGINSASYDLTKTSKKVTWGMFRKHMILFLHTIQHSLLPNSTDSSSPILDIVMH